MKPQDIIVVIAILSLLNSKKRLVQEYKTPTNYLWQLKDIAELTELSLSVVHRSVGTAKGGLLLDEGTGTVNVRRFFEFIIHAIGILYPLESRGPARGYSTTLSSEIFPSQFSIQKGLNEYVWPDANGFDEGLQLNPLHRSAVPLSRSSLYAYRVLAAIDSIRMERPREKNLAIEFLRKHY